MPEIPVYTKTPLSSALRHFCQGLVSVFYRQCEVGGIDALLEEGPVLLCANHSNALADALVLQAISPRLLHPLAKSSLFKNPFLKLLLGIVEGIPVYRRQDDISQMYKNKESFAHVCDILARGEVVLIFPEGQSHSDPKLRPIKTGAARMAMTAAREKGINVRLLPVGLTFLQKGHFRSTVFIKFGDPILVTDRANEEDKQQVETVTLDLKQGLESVTLNAEQAIELDFVKSLEHFFTLRHSKYRHRNLELRFRALKKLLLAHQTLKETHPEQLRNLYHHLQRFEHLCDQWGVNDYQLNLEYPPKIVLRYLLRILFIVIVFTPLGIWGMLNNFVPYLLTRYSARWLCKAGDQYDTAKMGIGLVLFPFFWLLQSYCIWQYTSFTGALLYLISLAPSAAAALMMRRQYRLIIDSLRTFFIFVRKQQVRELLKEQRDTIEKELARLARLVRRY